MKYLKKTMFIIACIVFIYSSYKLINYYCVMNTINKEFNKIENEVFIEEIVNNEKKTSYKKNVIKKFNYEKLNNKNSDCIGWINIQNTKVDYPVMYKEGDNNFYLRRNINKEYSIAGIPFLDGNCSLEEKKALWIIYGHHMKDGSLFGGLSKYNNKKFYEQNKKITLYIKNTKYIYEIFAYGVISAITDYNLYNVNDFRTDKGYEMFLSDIKKKINYNKDLIPEKREDILILSTCDYTKPDGRMIVVAKRVK